MKERKEIKMNESRGLRLGGGLWRELDELAAEDNRTTSQYIKLILQNAVAKKKLKKQ